MILNEIILSKPIIEETQRVDLPDGVLSRVSYLICNVGKRNANNRVYEKAVWDKVSEQKDLQEQMTQRALFGHAEHPEQTQSNLEKTSHVIFEMWQEGGGVWQKMDILDTPGGRIVDTLIRAGCQVGVSTRAEGDLEEAEDDDGTYQRVIPESYIYTTTDFTADPSTFGTIPQDVKRNIVSEIKRVLESKEANESEEEFAYHLLESWRCKKIGRPIGRKHKCQNCGCCEVLKENKIKEGVWALPYSVTKAKKLAKLMKEPLSSSVAIENLHKILGEDDLWDDFKYKGGDPATDDDVRPLIKKRVKLYLEEYEKDPKDFKQKLDPEAEKILKGLVVEQRTIESLVRDKLIKIDTELKYGNADAKVEKIEEGIVGIVSDGRHISIDGAAYVTIHPDSSIVIQPKEDLPEPTPAPEAMPEEPPRVTPGSATATIVDDDEIPEGKKQPDKESIEVGSTIKIEEGEHKDKEGRVTKIEETGITIALDDGTTVSIEDPTAINITVLAPAPAEEIKPVCPSEEEVEDMEAAGPLPIKKDIPDEPVAEGRPPTEDRHVVVAREHEGGVGVFMTGNGKDRLLRACKDKEEADKFGKKYAGDENVPYKGMGESNQIPEGKLPTEDGVSDKIAPGNLLRDEDNNHFVVKSVTPAGLSLEKSDNGVGITKHVDWNEVGDLGLVKIGEKVIPEGKVDGSRSKRLNISFTTDRERDFIKEIGKKYHDQLVGWSMFAEDVCFDGTPEIISKVRKKIEANLSKYPGITIEESQVKEATVVQRDDGWYVVSPAGKDLGGPYNSEGAANLRKKDVEFYAASKESKVDEDETERSLVDLDIGKFVHSYMEEHKGEDAVQLLTGLLSDLIRTHKLTMMDIEELSPRIKLAMGMHSDAEESKVDEQKYEMKVGQEFVYGGAKHTITLVDEDIVITSREVTTAKGTEKQEMNWARPALEMMFADPDKYNLGESKVEETADIKAMYKAAKLPAPDGKGIHTKAFHELVIDVAKGYVKGGDTPKEALDKAYPTAMKQLGKEKAVKKAHRKSESKLEEEIGVGVRFNYEGKTWKIVRAGKTQSLVQSITGEDKETRIIDNKIIVRALGESKVDEEQKELTADLVMTIAQRLASVALDEVPVIDIIRQVRNETGGEYVTIRKFVRDTLASEGWGVPPRESKVDESISTTVKEIKDLQVKEASMRSERDKAIEFLEELTDEKQQLQEKARKEKAFEVKILIKKMSKVLEDREQEVEAFRVKLEEKLKLVVDLKEQLEEKNKLATKVEEQLNEIKANLSNDIKDLKESATFTENKHQKDLTRGERKHQRELDKTVKSLEEKIERTNEETEKRIKEKVTKEVTQEFVKSFVEFKLSETGLKVDDNSRALLENCTSLEEVDDLLDEIIGAGRRSALHSESILGIHISERVVVDPEEEEAKRQVDNCFEGMNP